MDFVQATPASFDFMSTGPTGWDHYPGMHGFRDDLLEFASSWMQQRQVRHPPGCTCSLHRTHISDLPEPILTNIFINVKDVRSRNSMSLVCRDWYLLDRYTRTQLCLRGNIVDLESLPMCFNQVTTLDLSLTSPWGYSLFHSTNKSDQIARLMVRAFPLVKDLTIYVKNVFDVQLIPYLWPDVESVSLVRWHQRPEEPQEALEPGTELHHLLTACTKLRKVDLSKFSCWTEDVPPALVVGTVASSLKSLNLLKISTEGFRAHDLDTITKACKGLEEFFVLCEFDPRLVDPVGDQALISLGKTCTQLRVLHLVDSNAWDNSRGDVSDGFTGEDASISRTGLQHMFQALPHLEELVFLVAQSVKEAGPALETLPVHCKKLRVLKVSHFHGLCKGPEPDGVARCKQLVKLCIKNCPDLNNDSLVAIAKGCSNLEQLHLRGISTISPNGLAGCVKRLAGTLKDVEVSRCEQLNTAQVLKALEPIRATVQTLTLDCVWDMDIVARERAAAAASVRAADTLSVSDILGMSAEDLFSGSMSDMSGHGRHPALTRRKNKTRSSGAVTSGRTKTCDPVGPDTDFVKVGFEGPKTTSDFVTVGFDAGDEAHSDFVTMGFDPGLGSDFVTIGFDSGDQFRPQAKKARTFTHDEDLFGGLPGNWDQQSGFDAKGMGRFEGVGYFNGFHEDTRYSAERDHMSGNGAWMHGQLSHHTDCKSMYAAPMKCLEPIHGSRMHKETEVEFPGVPAHNSLPWSTQSSPQVVINKFPPDAWSSLKRLSLCIAPWDLIEYLPLMGLRRCPVLEEIDVRVEGDVKALTRPPKTTWGLGSLQCYPALSKLSLDVSDAQGYALSAPQGCLDLSQWERYFLTDLRLLQLQELNYTIPVDKDLNYRGLSLPGAGLIAECLTLRKLFLHGTVHEHFLFMLKQLSNLRDFQLRSDYHPAPAYDASTELRPLSCTRFEVALTQRGFPD